MPAAPLGFSPFDQPTHTQYQSLAIGVCVGVDSTRLARLDSLEEWRWTSEWTKHRCTDADHPCHALPLLLIQDTITT